MQAYRDKLVSLADAPIHLGGPGSGNFGHAGRPGEVGGSAPQGEGGSEGRGSRAWIDDLLTRKVGPQGGSNPGGSYETANGQKYYVKRYREPAQANGEVLSNFIYRELGFTVPESYTVEASDGHQYIASKWMDGIQTIGERGLTRDDADEILDGFAADVFLANWDTVGMGHDNVARLPDGRMARLDQGGTLFYRAQGAPKDVDALKSSLSEWDNFVTRNRDYAELFKAAGLKNADALGSRAVAQIDRVLALPKKHGSWGKVVEKALPRIGDDERQRLADLLDARATLLERKRNTISLSGTINLPDIADVKGPSMIGGGKPSKRRKRYRYRGVMLSRRPMKFEAQVLSLAEIPAYLDDQTANIHFVLTSLHLHWDRHHQACIRQRLADVADYGATEVLKELVRQGARHDLLSFRVPLDVGPLVEAFEDTRAFDLSTIEADVRRRLHGRRLPEDYAAQFAADLTNRRLPAMHKRHAAHVVHAAFAYGRAAAIDCFHRRPQVMALAYRDESGKFVSIADAVAGGDILVDAVVQSAVMDTHTCEECAEVDGEVMDLGDSRQRALHPPYVKCLGGNRCRCVQIAILDNGMEIDVDEILDEDTTLD